MPRSVRIRFPCFAPAFQVQGHPPAWLLVSMRSIPFLPVFADKPSAATFAAARHAGLSVVPLQDPSALREALEAIREGRVVSANVLYCPCPGRPLAPIAHGEAVRPRDERRRATRGRAPAISRAAVTPCRLQQGSRTASAARPCEKSERRVRPVEGTPWCGYRSSPSRRGPRITGCQKTGPNSGW